MAKNAAYYEAGWKIEAVLRVQGTSLDLSAAPLAGDSARLTELPESLTRLTQLWNLDLSGNRLTTLPESLSQLAQLKLLVLSGNQLTTLPESLIRLDNLKIFRG
ncbi:MAG: hypothetical protein LGR52_06275 [Candidatus Thiosymbion ectosymbiont of Robbea hypermnestra]|nr:hypothetical protein [Candidatus Thiosymbion ectosymbiont of Robbea hypermnestra]